MKKIDKNTVGVVAAILFAVIIPSLAFAQGAGGGAAAAAAAAPSGGGLSALLNSISGWLKQISLLLFALATLTFFWGMIKFIWSGDKEEGKTIMVWGILALFVMFSVWAIVKFLQASTGTDSNGLTPPPVPGIPGNGGNGP